MAFPERTIKNYALAENVIMHGLDAVTLCFFVEDNPWDNSNERQCAFSYAVPGQHNEFSFCTSPTLEVVIHGVTRFFIFPCFTWYFSFHWATSFRKIICPSFSLLTVLMPVDIDLGLNIKLVCFCLSFGLLNCLFGFMLVPLFSLKMNVFVSLKKISNIMGQK